MKTIKDLKASMPQRGQLEWIGLRPVKREKLNTVESVNVSTTSALEGDHYAKPDGKRMVTLIQKEHLDTVATILKKDIDPSDCRRNLVVSGINLYALHDAQFTVGDEVVLEGTGFCHPCSRMEANLGEGGYNAMRGHGGITARVIKGGRITLGDSIGYLDKASS